MTEGYLGSLSKWCSKKDRCMRILAALNLIWLAKIFIYVAFKAPPKKKKSLEVPRHGLDKFQETLLLDPIRYMQNIITPSENPTETLDLSG